MRTRVKICGITSPVDGIAAAQSGADAIGLVFYPPSPRALSTVIAREIVDSLPPFVTTVGLFVDMPQAEIDEILAAVPLDMLQFHGSEDPLFCASFDKPWMKAVRMSPEVDLLKEEERYFAASALLVDAYKKGVPGGTGQSFDWGRVPVGLQKPIVLAGGLTPENVEQAIKEVSPWAVDVSGGVERAKGVKDLDKVAQFINRAVNLEL
jgi:phosphoribosylanthranilate isomerase